MIAQILDELIMPSAFFSTFHALSVAYLVRKDLKSTSLVVIGTHLLGLGGSILINFLLGEPQSILYSSTTIPLYSLAALATMSFISPANPRDRTATFSSKARVLGTHVIDAFGRGYHLAQVLTNIRVDGLPLFSQFLLGFLAITGGGFLYNFVFKKGTTIGHDETFILTCVGAVVLLNLIIFEAFDATISTSPFLYSFKTHLTNNNFSFPELKLGSSLLILAALLIVQGPARQLPKSEIAAKTKKSVATVNSKKKNDHQESGKNAEEQDSTSDTAKSPRLRSRRMRNT